MPEYTPDAAARHLPWIHPDNSEAHVSPAPHPEYCKAHADTFETIEELLKEGRWTDAEVMTLQVKLEAPECALVPLYLGRIHYYRRNDRQALALFNELAERHPDIYETYHFRGLIFHEQGLNTVALEEFHKVMLVNPTIGSGYFVRYILPFLGKDARLDAVHIDSLLQYVTMPPARALTRGFLAFYQDDYAQALAHFLQVISANPMHTAAWLYAGRCYEKLRMGLQALNCFNQAIAIDDTYATAYFFRGLTKLSEGNWYRGCRDLQKAKSLEHPGAEMTIRNFCRRGVFQ